MTDAAAACSSSSSSRKKDEDGIINAIDLYNDWKCSNCGEKDQSHTKLKRCSRCVKHQNPDPAVYCSRECQAAHWGTHKGSCKKIPPEVLAARKRHGGVDWCETWRKTEDGGYHFGDLELITWDGVDEDGDEMGWGGTHQNKSHRLKKKFQEELGGDKLKLLKHFDSAFRWTCCGMNADIGLHGCDHHGRSEARAPCACDFCRMGKPLPARLIEKRRRSQAAHGIAEQLCNGPDPRSYDPLQAQMAQMMRGVMGLDL